MEEKILNMQTQSMQENEELEVAKALGVHDWLYYDAIYFFSSSSSPSTRVEVHEYRIDRRTLATQLWYEHTKDWAHFANGYEFQYRWNVYVRADDRYA